MNLTYSGHVPIGAHHDHATLASQSSATSCLDAAHVRLYASTQWHRSWSVSANGKDHLVKLDCLHSQR